MGNAVDSDYESIVDGFCILGRRRKKILIAAHVAAEPDWAPCGKCACKDGVNPIPKWSIAGVMENSRLCPRRQFGEDEMQWLVLFRHYQAGHLYLSGGVAVQPTAYLRAMRLIESVANSSKDES